MAARGYPPRTCRCPAGSRRAASSPPIRTLRRISLPAHEWRITGNPRRTPRERKPASMAGQGKDSESVSWHAPSCRDRSNSCRARSAAARGSDRRRRRCRNAAPPGRGRPAPALYAAGAIVVAGVEHQLIDPDGSPRLAAPAGRSGRRGWSGVVAISSSCWPSTRYSSILMPWPGQPCAESSTCVVKRPMGCGRPLADTTPPLAFVRWGSLRDLPGAARLQPAREPLAKQYKLSFDELYTKTPPQPKMRQPPRNRAFLPQAPPRRASFFAN